MAVSILILTASHSELTNCLGYPMNLAKHVDFVGQKYLRQSNLKTDELMKINSIETVLSKLYHITVLQISNQVYRVLVTFCNITILKPKGYNKNPDLQRRNG